MIARFVKSTSRIDGNSYSWLLFVDEDSIRPASSSYHTSRKLEAGRSWNVGITSDGTKHFWMGRSNKDEFWVPSWDSEHYFELDSWQDVVPSLTGQLMFERMLPMYLKALVAARNDRGPMVTWEREVTL